MFKPLPDDKILWASERSGWNHLYRFDAASGELVNAVTSGDWNVKRIKRIDREKEVVWSTPSVFMLIRIRITNISVERISTGVNSEF